MVPRYVFGWQAEFTPPSTSTEAACVTERSQDMNASGAGLVRWCAWAVPLPWEWCELDSGSSTSTAKATGWPANAPATWELGRIRCASTGFQHWAPAVASGSEWEAVGSPANEYGLRGQIPTLARLSVWRLAKHGRRLCQTLPNWPSFASQRSPFASPPSLHLLPRDHRNLLPPPTAAHRPPARPASPRLAPHRLWPQPTRSRRHLTLLSAYCRKTACIRTHRPRLSLLPARSRAMLTR